MDAQFFLPITKRDDDQHMVYGYASTPDLDSQGEIVTLEAIEKALPEYLKFPTIREMHEAKAVGVTKEVQIDGKKGLYIGAKVVDKVAWEKVKEGVYRAFSIGGKIVEKAGNKITELVLTEISLVDSPANKAAIITLFKMEDNMKKVPDSLKKYMEEYSVAEKAVDVDLAMQEDVMDAARILSMACELCYTYYFFHDSGKPTERLQEAINALKYLAIQLLTQTEYNKFDSILSTINQSTGGSAKHVHDFLKTQSGRSPLLKGVRMSQVKKADEVVETKVEVKDAEPKKDDASVDTTPVKVPSEEEKQPKKEASEKNEALEKLEAMEAKLNKKEEVAEDEEEEEVEKKADSEVLAKFQAQEQTLEKMNKQVVALTEVIGKMSSVLEGVVSRVTAVEATPAAPKTVTTFAVEKTVTTKGDKTPQGKRLEEVQTRLKELEKIRSTNLEKFQSDHQTEAFELMDELHSLL